MSTRVPTARGRHADAHPAIARRRTRVRRARRGRAALTAATVVAAAALGSWLATGPLLTVSGARVTGYTGPTSGPVTQAVTQAAQRGGSLLSLPVGDIRRAALSDPWVADVIVRRDWPAGVVVEVMPARPTAVGVTRSGQTMLVSADGRSMGPVTGGAGSGLTRVGVPTSARATLGAQLPPSTRAALGFVEALPPEVAARITRMDVSHGLVIGTMRSGVQVRAGTPGNMAAKAASFVAVLEQVTDDELATAQYIDVSVPDHPALGGPDADPRITRGVVERVRGNAAASPATPTGTSGAPTATPQQPATAAPATAGQTAAPAATPTAQGIAADASTSTIP